MATIYTDADRTLDVTDHVLRVANKPNIPPVQLARTCTGPVDSRFSSALKQQGKTPSEYFVVQSERNMASGTPMIYICLPNACREAVEAAIAEANPVILVDPAVEERLRIEGMFDATENLRDYPGDYFRALHKAQDAYTAWQEQYPEAARSERKNHVLADAEDLERKAHDALTYDADGWLDAAARQTRHDALMAEAQAKRSQAEEI